MTSVNQVGSDEIGRLKDPQLTELLARLLSQDCRNYGIYESDVHISPSSVPDGGVDAKVEWQGGVERTDYIPSRDSGFQCKATKMGPKKWGEEVLCRPEPKQRSSDRLSKESPKSPIPAKRRPKPEVGKLLTAGGTYIAFYGRRSSSKADCKKNIIDALKRNGLTVKPDQVVCYDAGDIAKWANKYPPIVRWVRYQCGLPGQPGVLSWSEWAEHDSLGGEYFLNEKLLEYRNQLRAHFLEPRSVARIVGLSGLGKTRLALEVFRPASDSDDNQQQALSVSVLYYDAESVGQEFLDFVTGLCTGGPCTLIVDNCSIELHNKLERRIRRQGARISLLTIDWDQEGIESTYSCPIVRLEPSQFPKIISQVLKDASPNLTDQDIEFIQEIAQGFVQIAVWLAESRTRGDPFAAKLDKERIVKRLLWPRGGESESERSILRACSLFDSFRFQRGEDDHCRFLGELAGHSADVVVENCMTFQKRGLLQRRGRYLLVVPKVLAIRLAGEWVEYASAAQQRLLLENAPKESLTEALCSQMKYLDYLPEAQLMVENLCGPTGPLGQAEALNTEVGSRLFGALAEVNPRVAVETLIRVFSSMSRKGLLEIGPGRRSLVWCLEKLCFRKDTFEDAAKVMLGFASAENETWANNASSQYVQLFRTSLPGTEANLHMRIPLWDMALKSGDREKEVLTIKALSQALDDGPASRTGGPEIQGTQPRKTDYEPGFWSEIHEYWDAALERLVTIACSGSDSSELAKNEIAARIGDLSRAGRLNKVRDAVNAVISAKGNVWPEALNALREGTDYWDRQPSAEEAEILKQLVAALSPADIAGRLKTLVSQAARDFEEKEGGGYTDLAAERAAELARELAIGDQSWLKHVSLLYEGEQREGFAFGQALAESFDNPLLFIEASIRALGNLCSKRIDPAALAGFLSCVKDRHVVAEANKQILASKELASYAGWLIGCSRPDKSSLEALLDATNEGRVSIRSLGSLEMGGVLKHLDVPTFVWFVRGLMKLGPEATLYALSIANMYSFDEEERREEIRPAIRELLHAPGIIAALVKVPSNKRWSWKEWTCMIVREGHEEVIAKHITTDIVTSLKEVPDLLFRADHYVGPVLEAVLDRYIEVVWPIVGEALQDLDRPFLYRFRRIIHGLSGRGPDRKEHSVFNVIPTPFLMEWCQRTAPNGPHALSSLVSVYDGEGDELDWHPHARVLIDEFGDLDGVIECLSSSMRSGTWSGSMIPFLDRQLRLIVKMKDHARITVRNWANERVRALREEMKYERLRNEEESVGIYNR